MRPASHARHKRLVEEFLARYREGGIKAFGRVDHALPVTALHEAELVLRLVFFGFVRDDDCIIKGMNARRIR